MKVQRLDKFVKGWFIGPFQPTLLSTDEFEVAIKRYKAGDHEARHHHRVAVEFTAIISGQVVMNGRTFAADDVIEIPPNVSTDFTATTDTVTVVVKRPALVGDKYDGPGSIS